MKGTSRLLTNANVFSVHEEEITTGLGETSRDFDVIAALGNYQGNSQKSITAVHRLFDD